MQTSGLNEGQQEVHGTYIASRLADTGGCGGSNSCLHGGAGGSTHSLHSKWSLASNVGIQVMSGCADNRTQVRQ